jgi:hypothetical protein
VSLIKAIRQQLGLSVTPANNFTLDASADNGTMKLARGNAGATTQDVMTVNAAGKVAFPQNAQTLQDVLAGKATGTTYTNTTGQAITAWITATYGNLPAGISVNVNGVMIYGSTTNTPSMSAAICITVPPNGQYTVTGNNIPSLTSWVELRN